MKQQNARNHGKLRAVLSLVLFFLVMGAVRAEAWWNEDWKHRRKVTLDAAASGANLQEGLTDQTVLLRLHAGNFNFAMSKPDGGDLRFIGLDDKTILKHQVVAWSQADEMALVRVKPGAVTGNPAQDGFFLYYTNPKAAAPADGAGLTDPKQALLLHLDETEGLPKDATVNGNHATAFTGGLATPAVVGAGITLFGGGEKLTVNASPSLALPDALTFTGWLRVNTPQNDAILIQMGETGAGRKGLVIGVNGMRPYLKTGDGATSLSTTEDKALKPETWHHLAATVGSGEAVLYLDGAEAARTSFPGNPGPFAGPVSIGADPAGGHPLAADLDELGLAAVVRSAAWVRANFASQGPDGALAAVGLEEVSGSGGAIAEQMQYFRIIFGNITIDGYAIMAVLALMGVFAWLVFIRKAYVVWLSGKDTKAFLAAYRGAKAGAFTPDGDRFSDSPLYRVYQQGWQELQELRGGGNGEGNASPVSLAPVRAAMDRGFVMESKGLNSWLTALILCTSGGPFLGLLGTVWGVMNTFAAMAAAGEANIMAIAPGVASALACTVTGLLVAIPSLMAYNFLVVQVKGITVDLAVFVDEFNAMVEKQFGGSR